MMLGGLMILIAGLMILAVTVGMARLGLGIMKQQRRNAEEGTPVSTFKQILAAVLIIVGSGGSVFDLFGMFYLLKQVYDYIF